MNIKSNTAAKSHIATIEECEKLTDDIIKSAVAFIITDESYENGDGSSVTKVLRNRMLKEIAGSGINAELLEELTSGTSERIYNAWKRYKRD